MSVPRLPADKESAGPYFFLSYAHVPPYDLTDGGGDPNQWVEKLFRVLCGHIMHLTKVPAGSAGYMDRALRTGDDWALTLSKQLSTCRVFVPLYSPRYFESEHCGKEWAAFLDRTHGHGEPLPAAIVPAIWTPMRSVALPEAAEDIQFNHADLGARYAEEGFYGIMKLNKYRNQYQDATLRLAQRIIEVAEQVTMPVGRVDDYREMPSAFTDNTPERPMTLTVVAPDMQSLPDGRDAYHYGRTPHEWDPYRSRNGMRPLADFATELARSRGFLPEVGSLEDHAEALAAEEPRSPGVMLVDPWATTREECRATLRPIDRPGRQWIAVMVPWNREDTETVARESQLRSHLTAALGNKLTEPAAVSDIPTLDAFKSHLPDTLNRAAQQYFKHAPAYPPEGGKVDRPRLIGPEE
ncbi:TIR-like protein FxsC [Streptosporangium sp. 'caverna']|uniref:TIR-like protein FxsC n=1 Tax=Streptosporangium sp. 'caverna' TaxID=2202249 RepID=UPI000D7EA210|nr:TIR-like protein FxsC [Streptosporangium sp. 'caverna']AWS40303.1 FxsC protein [Streptosporangium sp. 'caverna']